MQLLQTSYAISPDILWYYPLFFQKLDASTSSFKERKDFIFIGNFWHEPNWQAVKYLKEQIWPLVSKALPQVSMQIYGAYASEKVLQLQNLKQRFIVNGRAENALQKVSAARVCLAPLSFGAGLKGKLLEAMQVGTPSVTTQVGAEGIASSEDWPGFVAQTPENIALAAVQLYDDFDTWQSAQNKGFSILENGFKQELYEGDFLEHVVSLRQNLKKHRERNFMGAVLQHQTMASTEYMSRWIEAKTKLS
jgi:glycosyltransferase involved in cell wall biosynthesis